MANKNSSLYPIECEDCGTVYNSQEELKEVRRGELQFTYHCPECSIEIFGINVKKGGVMDSQIV